MSGRTDLEALQQSFRSIPDRIPRGVVGVVWAVLALGLLAFVLAIYGEQPGRAWQIYLVNFLFWTGLAQAGVVFAAVYRMTRAQWGDVIARIAEGMGCFLPIALLCFFPLIPGRHWLLPWLAEPIPGKAAWLNAPFFFLRNGVGLSILVALSLLYLYFTLRPQVGAAIERGVVEPIPTYRLVAHHWIGFEAEERRSHRALRVLAPALVVAYAFIFSMIGFDLIMSLDPYWYSTLFGGYFFMSSFYLGLAGLAALTIIVRRLLRLDAEITAAHFHDLGKLVFGFDMLIIGLLWSQFIVIWYGNITEETQYVILRTQVLPWSLFSWVAVIAGFLGPLIVFFNRRVKQDPFALLPMGLVIAGGLWIERYVLVVPALWKGPAAPLGFLELLITAGFASAAVLSYLAFITCFPILPWPRQVPENRH
jgi:Ni/Fe-hydrogenase subunit HybB-like protein